MAYDKIFTEEELISTAFARYPELEVCREAIMRACDALETCYRNGGRVLLCGNGGSSADCAHIAGELLKGFLSLRRLPEDLQQALRKSGELGELCADKLQGSLAAVDLTAQGAIIAAVANDTDPRLAYAQQLWGLDGRVTCSSACLPPEMPKTFAARALRPRHSAWCVSP